MRRHFISIFSDERRQIQRHLAVASVLLRRYDRKTDANVIYAFGIENCGSAGMVEDCSAFSVSESEEATKQIEERTKDIAKRDQAAREEGTQRGECKLRVEEADRQEETAGMVRHFHKPSVPKSEAETEEMKEPTKEDVEEAHRQDHTGGIAQGRATFGGTASERLKELEALKEELAKREPLGLDEGIQDGRGELTAGRALPRPEDPPWRVVDLLRDTVKMLERVEPDKAAGLLRVLLLRGLGGIAVIREFDTRAEANEDQREGVWAPVISGPDSVPVASDEGEMLGAASHEQDW